MKKSRPYNNTSELAIRVVSTEEQAGNVLASNLLDTRKKQSKKFGATFFLRPKATPATEAESWKYLEEKLSKRIKN